MFKTDRLKSINLLAPCDLSSMAFWDVLNAYERDIPIIGFHEFNHFLSIAFLRFYSSKRLRKIKFAYETKKLEIANWFYEFQLQKMFHLMSIVRDYSTNWSADSLILKTAKFRFKDFIAKKTEIILLISSPISCRKIVD